MQKYACSELSRNRFVRCRLNASAASAKYGPAMTAEQRFFLKEWRKLRGMTQEALAAEANTSKGHISDLERGKTPYNQSWLETFSAILAIRPEQLLAAPPAAAPVRRHLETVDADLLEDVLKTTIKALIAGAPRPLTEERIAAAAAAAAGSYLSYLRLRAEEETAA